VVVVVFSMTRAGISVGGVVVEAGPRRSALLVRLLGLADGSSGTSMATGTAGSASERVITTPKTLGWVVGPLPFESTVVGP
jgi:hypothetical protein